MLLPPAFGTEADAPQKVSEGAVIEKQDQIVLLPPAQAKNNVAAYLSQVECYVMRCTKIRYNNMRIKQRLCKG